MDYLGKKFKHIISYRIYIYNLVDQCWNYLTEEKKKYLYIYMYVDMHEWICSSVFKGSAVLHVFFNAFCTDRSRPSVMRTWWRRAFPAATATGTQPRWPTCLWTSCPALARSNWDTCPVSKSKYASDSTLVSSYFWFLSRETWLVGNFMQTMPKNMSKQDSRQHAWHNRHTICN